MNMSITLDNRVKKNKEYLFIWRVLFIYVYYDYHPGKLQQLDRGTNGQALITRRSTIFLSILH